MANPYRHPISTPVPELQGIASIAATPAARGEGLGREPTQAMLEAGNVMFHRGETPLNIWRAMWDAAPTLPPVGDATEAQPCAAEAMREAFEAGVSAAESEGFMGMSEAIADQCFTEFMDSRDATPPVQPEPRDRGAMGEEA